MRPHRSSRWPWTVWLVAAVVLVAACSGGSGRSRTGSPTITDAPPPATEPIASPTPTSAVTTSSAPAATVAAAGSCPEISARTQPDPDRPRYRLTVDVRPPAERTASGSVEVRFVANRDTDRLVFRLWPNGPRQAAIGPRLETGPVTVDGVPASSSLEAPTTLVVRPSGGVIAGRPVVARMDWKLRLPGAVRDRIAAGEDAVRLGSFFPILSWDPARGWATEPPTTQFAESNASPTADFDITVAVPPGYLAVVSGASDGPGHWTAAAMRDVAVSVGRFKVVTAQAHVPNPVVVTVAAAAGTGESPERYLTKAVAVVEDFSRRFGPYPWSTLSISITPTLRSGIEYPAHLMHGPGTAGRQLSHEIGHQWFYALVGNNQGLDPWLDEALATWAEARFEGTVASYRARPVPAGVKGRVGEPMTFWDGRSSTYYVGAYVQGAQALASLGSPDLVDCALRLYVARHAYAIARPGDLIDAMSAVLPDAPARLAAFGIRR